MRGPEKVVYDTLLAEPCHSPDTAREVIKDLRDAGYHILSTPTVEHVENDSTREVRIHSLLDDTSILGVDRLTRLQLTQAVNPRSLIAYRHRDAVRRWTEALGKHLFGEME